MLIIHGKGARLYAIKIKFLLVKCHTWLAVDYKKHITTGCCGHGWSQCIYQVVSICDICVCSTICNVPTIRYCTYNVCIFIYLLFYVAFNTVQVISRRVVGRAEETSTYSSLGFCTVNCRPTASNYQLSHLRPWRGSNPGLRGGRRECYHSPTVAAQCMYNILFCEIWEFRINACSVKTYLAVCSSMKININ